MGGRDRERSNENSSEPDLENEPYIVNRAKESVKIYQRRRKLGNHGRENFFEGCDLKVAHQSCDETVQMQEVQVPTPCDTVLSADDGKTDAKEEAESVVKIVVGLKERKARIANGVRFPTELRQQVLDDLKMLPEEQVCQRWGVSRTSTRRWAQEAGIERIHLPRPGHSQHFKERVLETYRKFGLSTACREHGVDKLTVYKWSGRKTGQKGCKIFSPELKAEVVVSYHKFGPAETSRRFKIATRTIYRWLNEFCGGSRSAEDAKEEKSDEGDLDLSTLGKRKRAKFSTSFKASVLAAYSSVGPAQAARKFGITEGLLMQWRRKAGVVKFTEGAKKISKDENDVQAERKTLEDISEGEGEEKKKQATNTMKGLKKPVYPAEMRSEVLSFYSQHGMKSTLAKFPVKPNAVQRWRRKAGVPRFTTVKREEEDAKMAEFAATTLKMEEKVAKAEVGECQRSKSSAYDEDFRKEVLAHYEKFGQAATCRKYKVCNATIYHWLRNGTSSKCKYKYSEETRNQAIELAIKVGQRAAARALGLSQPLLARWIVNEGVKREKAKNGNVENVNHDKVEKEANVESDSEVIETSKEADLAEVVENKSEVLELARRCGVAQAAKQHQLPLTTVWRWRDEERRAEILQMRKTKTEEMKKQRSKYNPQMMEKVVEFYFKHGAIKSEKEFNVPRQTVRHWARRKMRGVPMMGKVLRKRYYDSVGWKQEAIAFAKAEGVSAALKKYQVSRGILYKWERDLRKQEPCEGNGVRKAKYVFRMEKKKREKVVRKKKDVKPKKEKVKPKTNEKSKKSKKKNEWVVTPVLPDWAIDFLKPSKQKKEIVLASEAIPLIEDNACSAQTSFSLSIPVVYQEQDDKAEEFDSMPRFSPQGVSQGGTLDPPSILGGVKDCLVEVVVSQL